MPAATSRNVKHHTRKRRPALQHTIRPGYCTFNNWEKFINFVVTKQLQEGDEITMRMLKDGASIQEGEVYLVRATARHLKFLDPQNRVTKTLVQFTQAGDDKYRVNLRGAIELAYHAELDRIGDLGHATQQELRDAFNKDRTYEKTTLQKIVALFQHLCQQAGIISDEVDQIDVLQVASEPITDTLQAISPLHDVSLVLTEYNLMTESSSPKTNGLHPVADFSMVEKLVASFAQLHQLAKSTEWSDASRAIWIDYVKVNSNLLGNALELIERTKQ